VDEDIIEFQWAGETARRLGTVVHRALQIIAREGATAWDQKRLQAAAPVLRTLLVQAGVGRGELDSALARSLDMLTRTLADPTAQWLLDPGHTDARSEYALSGILEGRLVTGIIDRSFVDADGVRWIVDYKTGGHEGGALEDFLAAERERYAAQLARYARLMRAREQRPVRLALYFPALTAFTDWAAPETGGNDA
jgi:ATP-dependent exoDNAse (exonuclease V) beta subunit